MTHANRQPRSRATALVAVAPVPSADAIVQARDEVFRRSEFGGAGRSNAWWLRPLRDFFEWLGGLYDNAPGLFWLILLGCLFALVAMIVLIAFQVRGVFVTEGRLRNARDAGQALRIRLSATYRAEAGVRADAGDYTEAVRFLFLSLVYRLDEQGRVGFDKAYTNREYLDLVAERLAVRDALQVLVDVLDDHWYGQRPCDAGQYRECLAVHDRLTA